LHIPVGPQKKILELLTRGDAMFGMQMFDEDPTLKRGSIYVVLPRMERRGYVTSWEDLDSPVIAGMRRRYYRITPAGQRALEVARAAEQAGAQALEPPPGIAQRHSSRTNPFSSKAAPAQSPPDPAAVDIRAGISSFRTASVIPVARLQQSLFPLDKERLTLTLQILEEMIGEDPDDPALLKIRVALLATVGWHSLGRADADHVVKLEPYRADGYLLRALCDPAHAIDHAKDAVAHEPDNVEALRWLADLYYEKGRGAEAKQAVIRINDIESQGKAAPPRREHSLPTDETQLEKFLLTLVGDRYAIRTDRLNQ
jgi:tetratricopeptide (TPR) repeat protein